MKAECLDDKDPKNTCNMFSKFHQQPQKFHPPPPTIHHPNPQYHHHFHLGVKASQASEEADSAAAAVATTTTFTPPDKKPKTANEDGATIEVVRRPRGRPPGSKNKPKPPIVITREPDPVMFPYILEVQGGVDIVETLTRFTRSRNVGLCLLTASGSVANVTLKQPSINAGGTVTFHGRFDILSLSAVLLGGGGGEGFGFSGHGGNGLFTISLAGPQGQIVGGKVVGALLAAGTVYVIAASFNNPTFYRLPIDSEEVHHHSVSGRGGGGVDGQTNSPGVSGGGSGGSGDADLGGEGGGGGGGGETIGPLSMYDCHLGPDVLWAPTARPTPHHPY
ncbi:hypothetical protein Ancab_036510 [Ancistrocladus abbreviatus]